MQLLPYGIITIAILVGAALLVVRQYQFTQTLPSETRQAVFLTNGQVYFGHLSRLNRSYFELTDVYYIQEQLVQGESEAGETTDESQLSVVRLGNELHEPQNTIVINADHILMWENLELNSRVQDAINRDQQ